MMNGVADVVVADGFTGNAVLKSIEGTAMGIMGLLKTAITGGGLRAKLGALLLKDSLRGLKNSSTTQMLVERSCLVSRHQLSRLMAQAMPRLFIVRIRQIRTMLETDVVAQTAREFQENKRDDRKRNF